MFLVSASLSITEFLLEKLTVAHLAKSSPQFRILSHIKSLHTLFYVFNIVKHMIIARQRLSKLASDATLSVTKGHPLLGSGC
jgi:hypothetical protein